MTQERGAVSEENPEGAAVQVRAVRFEHYRDAFGIGAGRPRLSWVVDAPLPGWSQSAYEIEVSDWPGSVTWSSGRVRSGQSVLVPWDAPPLQSRDRRLVRVRVWGQEPDPPSPWSARYCVEAGLLNAADWTAVPVTPDWDTCDVPPLVRREFLVSGPVRSARLYVTALGVYEAEINGTRVGDHVLAPGWTSYSHRLRYQTFDVTGLLREGPNAMGALLADGWYRGPLGFGGGLRDFYGDRLALLAQLEMRHADGTWQTVGTDASWRAASGPIRSAGLYAGERYDARLERPGWSCPGFDDRDWDQVRVLDLDPARLVAPDGPPARRTEMLAPVAVSTSPSGKTIVDFGQNIAGRLRVKAGGRSGDTVTLRHAEVLQDGELCVRPLRAAAATDVYTLRGEGIEEWEPRFTFHGFRYAEIDGPVSVPDIRAVVCHTDLARTGWFGCSDPSLQQLHDNVVWSMRGNFLDIPTDCPQRDERLGWTGDIQVFAPTGAFLYDCAGMLTSWLADLAAEQKTYGTVPAYVPWVPLRFPAGPYAAWGDAAVIVPWVLYQRFGDLDLLRRQYPSMTAWVDGVASIAGDRHLWDQGFQFGDWLDPAAPAGQPGLARTEPRLVATAYLAYSADLLAQIAGLLGQREDAAHHARLADRVRAAFNQEFVTGPGRLASDTQTGYALALQFGLLPGPQQRVWAGRRLAELVRADGYHIGTGFVGTPLVCDALCAAGEYETAYRLLMQRECPSWLYPVTMGATTIWERWDSLLPDGKVNPAEMTSFNHYALGAVADWLHRTVAGLAPAAPGYRRILVRPRPGGGLTHAFAGCETPYGRAEVRWEIAAGGLLHVDVQVPPGTTALVDLPASGGQPVEIGPGRHRFTAAHPLPPVA
jgi:alpha-L-rhamnosidase